MKRTIGGGIEGHLQLPGAHMGKLGANRDLAGPASRSASFARTGEPVNAIRAGVAMRWFLGGPSGTSALRRAGKLVGRQHWAAAISDAKALQLVEAEKHGRHDGGWVVTVSSTARCCMVSRWVHYR